MKARILVVPATAALALFCCLARAQTGPGEKVPGLDGFTGSSWRAKPATQPSDLLHDGHKAVQINGGTAVDDVTVLWLEKPAIRLLAGQRYTASVWVKTANARSVELKIAAAEKVQVKGLNDRKVTGTRDWTRLEQRFTVSRDVQPKYIAVWMTGPGTAWASDFQLRGKLGAEWRGRVEIDPSGVRTEKAFGDLLERSGVAASHYVNWFTGRWPYMSFIGGMAMGNRSQDLEFFYEKPFTYWTHVLDYVMEGGGRRFGIRARVHRYKEDPSPAPMRSFLLTVRTDILLKDYHPSYICANGRRIWDARKHPIQQGKLCAVFSLEPGVDPVIDLVVDLDHTPEVKGLAFRMFFLQYLGEAGVKTTVAKLPAIKVDLKGAEQKASGSPADKLEKFPFGVFSSGYDFWTDKGPTFAEIRKSWRPNFRPNYPVDDVYLCPFVFGGVAKGKYHDFMVTYGGCNLTGADPDPALVKANAGFLRGALAPRSDLKATRKTLALGPAFEAHWFTGEGGNAASNVQAVAGAKAATGAPGRVKSVHEPFPPRPGQAIEYERGTDILILKNEEDPQYNLMMAFGRGAGRTFGKPFGFYWEQSHYPYPSLDEKLHECLLYFLSGGSWIGAEADNAPAFEKGVVADWVYPYVQAMRFAMVHPARGRPVVPIGILWTRGEAWWVPYTVFSQMDTFQRYIQYDHATRTFRCEPSFTKVWPWMPKERSKWRWPATGHMPLFIDRLDELKGYDLLDVFLPKYGDAYTTRITRRLTGTPHGPLDFVFGDKAGAEHLKSFGTIAVLGHALVRGDVLKRLTSAVESGVSVVIGAQHFRSGPTVSFSARPFGGLTFQDPAVAVEGKVTGSAETFRGPAGEFRGKVYGFKGDGWQTVAAAGGKPLVISKAVGKGRAYVYLGQWIAAGGAALRPILARLGEQAAPLTFAPADDYMEYVAYRKGAGAWVALFNHGNIVIGCDRLKKPRATPPEPLNTKPRGPYKGEIRFRLERLGLDPAGEFALYEVAGIDGKAFDAVISGHKTFTLRQVPAKRSGGAIAARVTIDKRAEYLIAPKGQGRAVFFGRP